MISPGNGWRPAHNLGQFQSSREVVKSTPNIQVLMQGANYIMCEGQDGEIVTCWLCPTEQIIGSGTLKHREKQHLEKAVSISSEGPQGAGWLPAVRQSSLSSATLHSRSTWALIKFPPYLPPPDTTVVWSGLRIFPSRESCICFCQEPGKCPSLGPFLTLIYQLGVARLPR